jgi:hypothetical protein
MINIQSVKNNIFFSKKVKKKIKKYYKKIKLRKKMVINKSSIK